MEDCGNNGTFQDTLLRMEKLLLDPLTDERKLTEALRIIGEYLKADRISVMQLSDEFYMSSICEWCAPGIVSLMNDRQNMDIRDFSVWYEAYRKKESIVIPCPAGQSENDSAINLRKLRQVLRLEGYPIQNRKGEAAGFIVADNPISTGEGSILMQMAAMSITYTFDAVTALREKEYERKQIEEALIKNCSDVYHINTETGKYRALKQTEKSVGEIAPEGMADESVAFYIDKYVSDENKSAVIQMLRLDNIVNKLKQENGYFTFDYRRVTEAEPEWYRVEVIASNYVDGIPVRLIACFHKIQEEKEQEEDHLRNSSIIDSIAEQYDFLYYVNITRDKFRVIRGIESEDLSRLGISELGELITYYVNSHVCAEDREKMRTFLLEDIRKIVGVGGYMKEREYRHIDKDGAYHWYRMQIIPFAGSQNGEGLIGLHDIHGRKKAELEKREVIQSLSEEYFGIYVVSVLNGDVKTVRSAENIEKRFGDQVKFIDLVNFSRDKLIAPEYEEELTELGDISKLRQHFQNCKRKLERTCRSRKGRWFTIHIMSTDLFDLTGEVIVAVRNSDAMMRQKQALSDALEASRKANDTKIDFMSKISHELRTPLNVILGMNTIAANNLNDIGKVEQCLTKMSDASGELLKLINQILSMSKVQAGRIELQEKEFWLNHLLEDMIQKGKETKTSKNILVQLHNQALNQHVMGDQTRIEEVFSDVMRLAYEYSNYGDTIEISVSEKGTGLSHTGIYEFVFHNSNLHLSEHTIRNAFEPLQSEGGDENGFSFGLSIIRNVLNMMNATMSAESTMEKGTDIRIWIYLKIMQESVTGEEQHSEEGQHSSFSGKHILIAEDKEINMEIMRELLKMLGISSEGAEDGAIAVKMVKESDEYHFDMILMDIRMPNMNGYEAAQAIRELDREDVKSIPIIAVTANSFADDIRQCLEAGMNEHLAKPIDRNAILKVMNRYFKEQGT